MQIDFQVQFIDEPSIECFPAKLSQVFMNIYMNACQAINERQGHEPDLKGNIITAVSIVDANLKIEIIDNGCGMSEETLKKVFEPFYTTKGVGKGTGLGMAITYGIVEEHKGRIDVQTELNKGTQIAFFLPL